MNPATLAYLIKRGRVAYPKLYTSPYDLLDCIFCVTGSGYEWVRGEDGVEYKRKKRYDCHPNAVPAFEIADKYLLEGVVPEWPVEFYAGEYHRTDLVPLVSGGVIWDNTKKRWPHQSPLDVTWDHTQKRKSYYPYVSGMLYQLATGEDQEYGTITNPSRDLIEGALAVCDLILENGREIALDGKSEVAHNNYDRFCEYKPQIVERWYGKNVHTYLVTLTEEDYEEFNEPIESALYRAMRNNHSVDPVLEIAANENWISIWPEGSAGWSGRAYLPDALLEQIEDKRLVTWLLVFYGDKWDAAIKTANSTAMIPYLSDMVVMETLHYQRRRTFKEIYAMSKDGGYAKRWLPMTPEEREADRAELCRQYLFAHEVMDENGNFYNEEDDADIFFPDPNDAIHEHNRREALAKAERDMEDLEHERACLQMMIDILREDID